MTAPAEPTDGIVYASARGRWVLFATVLGSAIAFIDATVVTIALPTIADDLGRHHGRPAVDGQRVRPDARGVPAAGRLARGPVRPAQGVPRRGRLVRGRVPALRGGADHRGLERGTRAAGGRRRPADPGLAGDPPVDVQRSGPRARDRCLVRARRHRRGGRPVPRRLDRRGHHVAVDLRHQPAPGRGGRRGDDAARAGERGRERGRRSSTSPARCSARWGWPV